MFDSSLYMYKPTAHNGYADVSVCLCVCVSVC